MLTSFELTSTNRCLTICLAWLLVFASSNTEWNREWYSVVHHHPITYTPDPPPKGIQDAAKLVQATKACRWGDMETFFALYSEIDLKTYPGISYEEILEYALNPEHIVGKHKATVFKKALGYDRSKAEDLIKQIYEKLFQSNAIAGKVDQYGQRYTVDILITGINGNKATVRTGWILKMVLTHQN